MTRVRNSLPVGSSSAIDMPIAWQSNAIERPESMMLRSCVRSIAFNVRARGGCDGTTDCHALKGLLCKKTWRIQKPEISLRLDIISLGWVSVCVTPGTARCASTANLREMAGMNRISGNGGPQATAVARFPADVVGKRARRSRQSRPRHQVSPASGSIRQRSPMRPTAPIR